MIFFLFDLGDREVVCEYVVYKCARCIIYRDGHSTAHVARWTGLTKYVLV